MLTIAKCIYCGEEFDPSRGEGDHVLPAGLFGEFENDRTFRGDCLKCNHVFSPLEQHLSQHSPIGFYRRVAHPNLGRRKKRELTRQKNVFHTIRLRDQTLHAEPTLENPLDLCPVDQLVVEDIDSIKHYIRLNKEMSSDVIKSKIEAIGKQRKKIVIDCEENHFDSYAQKLRESYPTIQIEENDILEPGNHRVRGGATFNLTLECYRGLAKIAFHYYLTWNRWGRQGNEQGFGLIRDFIKHGGSPGRFFIRPSRSHRTFQLLEQFAQEKQTREWYHIIGVDETDQNVIVTMAFFCHRQENTFRFPISVNLGRVGGSIGLPTHVGVWGSLYQQENNRNDRLAGQIHLASHDT